MRSASTRHRPIDLRCLLAALAVSALLIVSACGKEPDPADTLKSVASWLATGTLAAQEWVIHSTPNPFTRNTLRSARLAIADQQEILFTRAVPPVDTASLRASLERAKNTMATMERLIDRGDAGLFAAQLATLKHEADRVKQMSDSLEQSQ